MLLGADFPGARFSDEASVRRWRHAWRRRRQEHPTGYVTLHDDISQVHQCFFDAGGPIGRLLRKGIASRPRLTPGIAVDFPLPLPLVRVRDLPVALRRAGRARDTCVKWTNLIVVSINLMHAGREEFSTRASTPSAAQARMLIGLYRAVHVFVRDASHWPTGDEIRECLRVTSGYAPEGGAAVPLGDRGGVPAAAATVSVSQLLQDSHPAVAEQCRFPAALLLPPELRPPKLKRCYARLHASYPKLVARNCAAGLQRLVPGSRVWHHRGKRMVGGAFGVRKSSTEDRVISDLPVNQLVDPAKVLRPRFGFPPRLR